MANKQFTSLGPSVGSVSAGALSVGTVGARGPLNPHKFFTTFLPNPATPAGIPPGAFDVILMAWKGYINDAFRFSMLPEYGIGDNPELPPSIILGWDNDTENQKLHSDYYKDHLSDEVVELLILPPAATGMVMMVYSGYRVTQPAMQDISDIVELVIIFDPATLPQGEDQQFYQTVLVTHDLAEYSIGDNPEQPLIAVDWNIDEHQRPTSLSVSQDLAEYGMGDNPELPTIPIDDLTGTEWDQKYWLPLFSQDTLTDESVEKITITFNDWTLDSEQQKYNPLAFSSDYISDEGVEIVILPPAAAGIVLMVYSGYRVTVPAMIDPSDIVELVVTFDPSIVPQGDDQQIVQIVFGASDLIECGLGDIPELPLFLGWGNDVENQKQWIPLFGQDTLSDENVENIIIYNDWALDSEQQRSNPLSFGMDDILDSGVENIIIYNVWDTDTETQKQQLGYDIDREISDSGVERITLNIYNDWSNDSENQLLMVPYISDHLLDEGVERIVIYNDYTLDVDQQIPTPLSFGQDQLSDLGVENIIIYNDWTLDTENQKLQLPFYLDHLSDEIVEIIIRPFNDWTLDSEQQKLNPLYDLDRGVVDPGVENIIIYNVWDTDADNQKMQLLYDIDKDILDSGVEKITLTLYNDLGNDSENQKLMLSYVVDHLMDEGVEIVIIYNDWTLDSEQQQAWLLLFSQDDVLDAGVENIIIYNVWDNDTENQLLQLGYVFDKNLIDENVESLQYALGAITGHDTDAENQRQHPDYYKDHLTDEGTELITLPIVVLTLTAFDTDAENQKQWNPLFGQDTVFDEGMELVLLPPAADGVVLMSYKGYWYLRPGMQDITSDIVELPVVLVFDIEDQLAIRVDVQFIEDDRGISVVLPPLDIDLEQQLQPQVLTIDHDDLFGIVELQIIIIGDETQDLVWQEMSQDAFVDQTTFILLSVFDLDDQYIQREWIKDSQDDIVELVTTVGFLEFWDTDTENQFPQTLVLPFVEDDRGIQVILPPWEVNYEMQFAQQFQIVDHEDKVTNYIIIPTIPLGTDAENQKLQLDYYRDHLLDERVEIITLPTVVLVLTAFDTDVEQQKYWLSLFGQDCVSDENVEIIILPPSASGMVLMSYKGYINKAYEQDPTDIVELIVTLPFNPWDTDTETQIRQPDWNLDIEEEKEGVPYLAYAPGVIRNWDWEVDNQIPTAPWYPDLQGWEYNDLFKEIFIIVPLLYRISTLPVLAYALINTMCVIGMYVTQTDIIQAISAMESESVFAVSKISTEPLIGFTSVDTSMQEINRKK
jgi:hypothetical protein